MLKILGDAELSLLQEAVDAQVRQLVKHKETMEQCAASGGNEMISPDAARSMAELHGERCEQFRRMADLLAQSDECRLVLNDEFVEEE